MSEPSPLVIGTRASPLALAQAREVQARLAAESGLPEDALPLTPMTSTGDRIQNRALSEAGGKGLFTKELDEALLAGTIDLAVHSAKDLPTELPPGLAIAGYLPREDVRDVLLTPLAADLDGLPPGTVVGSASLRRQAMVLRARPDCRVTLLRGNVGTRLRRLESGEMGATLLALAGLKRLGLAHLATTILPTDSFLPAVGQGAIAITIRTGDERVARALAPLCDAATGFALAAERAFLAVLDGSCRTPIGGHATVEKGSLAFRGIVLTPDGKRAETVERAGDPADAEAIGREAGRDLRARLPAGWVAG
ncbi:hydroxymethylbilane synthase [Enterovirga rhinocerotis]|uniref:Porphobilinogen deaminase n=1 Tax=Enterovirga rhinocerotis TaxID=1339210 RepID=A0A4R7BVU5_9HYPH|nr:hydroxymethylbilane synthase [Enterovirga rhinocerotis]TDR89573.1 hydroxymethylbilane synthase [Enterovirga rhinocerotis]